MDEKCYYMMGLPASGKTTFLVAFTYMLLNQTEEVSLHMNPHDKQEGLTEEFRKEIDRWTSFKPLNHTAVGQINKMKYILYDMENKKYILEVPDRSGETFGAIIKDRYIDDNTLNDWNKADEILFFLNLDRMYIGDREELLTEIPINMQKFLSEDSNSISLRKENDENIILENNNDDFDIFPGQFTIVELLQMLCIVRKRKTCIKFIVSAWDRVQEANKGKKIVTPEGVFSKNLPLVYQFINTNKDLLTVQYWGVSAQGSNLEDEEEIKQMSYAVEPMERVKVVDTMGTISFDLSKIFME